MKAGKTCHEQRFPRTQPQPSARWEVHLTHQRYGMMPEVGQIQMSEKPGWYLFPRSKHLVCPEVNFEGPIFRIQRQSIPHLSLRENCWSVITSIPLTSFGDILNDAQFCQYAFYTFEIVTRLLRPHKPIIILLCPCLIRFFFCLFCRPARNGIAKTALSDLWSVRSATFTQGFLPLSRRAPRFCPT